MIKINNPSDCCGCTACASACPHEAISMKPDTFGFLYPIVDTAKCIDCGLCDKVCAFNDDYDKSLNITPPDVYLARHKDMNEVMQSRSGAAFVAISDYVLEQGGVVYGAGYKDHFRVAHKRAITKEERDEFRGSKYVQSDLTGVFKDIRDDLRNGLTVLFSGTGCQCAGLNAFIGKKLRENLILVDIVCHGVPGPYLWRDYLAFLEKKAGQRIVKVNFRDKLRYGWRAHVETFEYENLNGGGYKSLIFTMLFYNHIGFRHSCGVCHFCNTTRPSDITLADFWDRAKNYPQVNADNKGESLLFINTEKGRQLFEAIKDRLDYIPSTPDKVMQTHLREPSKIHPDRTRFEEAYRTHGFEYAMRRYGMMGWRMYWNKPQYIPKPIIRFIVTVVRKVSKTLHIC